MLYSGDCCWLCGEAVVEEESDVDGEPVTVFVCLGCGHERIVYDYEREEDYEN